MTCYASVNFKTKHLLKEAVLNHNRIRVRVLTPMGDRVPMDGNAVISGPWAPEPGMWHAECEVKDGVIVRVIK